MSGTPPNTPLALIRNLLLDVTEESVRLMMIFSDDLTDVEILSVEQSADVGFRLAVVRFKSLTSAQKAKSMLDGRPYDRGYPNMVVEIP